MTIPTEDEKILMLLLGFSRELEAIKMAVNCPDVSTLTDLRQLLNEVLDYSLEQYRQIDPKGVLTPDSIDTVNRKLDALQQLNQKYAASGMRPPQVIVDSIVNG